MTERKFLCKKTRFFSFLLHRIVEKQWNLLKSSSLFFTQLRWLQSLCEYSQKGFKTVLENTRRNGLRRPRSPFVKWICLLIQRDNSFWMKKCRVHSKWNAHFNVTLNGSICKWINGQRNWAVHFSALLLFLTWFVITMNKKFYFEKSKPSQKRHQTQFDPLPNTTYNSNATNNILVHFIFENKMANKW